MARFSRYKILQYDIGPKTRKALDERAFDGYDKGAFDFPMLCKLLGLSPQATQRALDFRKGHVRIERKI